MAENSMMNGIQNLGNTRFAFPIQFNDQILHLSIDIGIFTFMLNIAVRNRIFFRFILKIYGFLRNAIKNFP